MFPATSKLFAATSTFRSKNQSRSFGPECSLDSCQRCWILSAHVRDRTLVSSEPLSVLTRDKESFDHIGLLYPHQNVVTGLSETVQFIQPEVVACCVRVASQVAEVLRQHESRIELRRRVFGVLDCLAHNAGTALSLRSSEQVLVGQLGPSGSEIHA